MLSRIAVVVAFAALTGSAYAADALRPNYGPYPTQPMITGDIEFGAGAFKAAGTTYGLFSTTTRANLPVQGSLNFQAQTTANTLFIGGATQSWMDAYGHAWIRNPSSAWGIFGGAGFVGSTIAAIGAEAKQYLGNISVGAETAYLWSGSSNAWELGGTANLYVTPNNRFGVGAQYFRGFGGTSWNLNLDAEARFAGGPWSIFGWTSFMNLQGTNAWAGLVGFRWFLDAPGSTQQSHEKDVPFWFHGMVPFTK